MQFEFSDSRDAAERQQLNSFLLIPKSELSDHQTEASVMSVRDACLHESGHAIVAECLDVPYRGVMVAPFILPSGAAVMGGLISSSDLHRQLYLCEPVNPRLLLAIGIVSEIGFELDLLVSGLSEPEACYRAGADRAFVLVLHRELMLSGRQSKDLMHKARFIARLLTEDAVFCFCCKEVATALRMSGTGRLTNMEVGEILDSLSYEEITVLRRYVATLVESASDAT